MFRAALDLDGSFGTVVLVLYIVGGLVLMASAMLPGNSTVWRVVGPILGIGLAVWAAAALLFGGYIIISLYVLILPFILAAKGFSSMVKQRNGGGQPGQAFAGAGSTGPLGGAPQGAWPAPMSGSPQGYPAGLPQGYPAQPPAGYPTPGYRPQSPAKAYPPPGYPAQPPPGYSAQPGQGYPPPGYPAQPPGQGYPPPGYPAQPPGQGYPPPGYPPQRS